MFDREDDPGETGLDEGIVIRTSGGQCTVVAGGKVWPCRLRGRLKQGERKTQAVAVAGDRVRFRPLGPVGDPEGGVIEEVLPRRNRISRLAARRVGGRIEQILMANLDQVVAVQSLAEPAPQTGFVDRLLVAAERFAVGGILVLNKIDLAVLDEARSRWTYYESLGYQVIWACADDGRGVSELEAALCGKTSILLGASGVGKTSLLNAIDSELGLKVAGVTAKTGLGRHTTTQTELFPLPAGGFIADSPGLRGFDPWDIDPLAVRDYFPDFREATLQCRFRTCLHRDEPDCGVKNLVRSGDIPDWRHSADLGLVRDLEKRRKESGFRR